MKNSKLPVCLFLVLFISLFLLTGCNGTVEELPSQHEQTGQSAPTATPEPAQTTTDTDPTNTGTDKSELPYSAGLDDNGFWKGIKALDYIERFEYDGMTIPNEVHQISDEVLQAQIDSILANFASVTQVADRAVVDGDTVNIDYVGSIDGVEFDGGSTGGAGTEVTIGVTEYIDDFLAQLIGHTPGETINVEVTFPDDYHETTLQGKDALFVTTINYITGEAITPELTDDFVVENLTASYGWTGVADMKENILTNLKRQSIEQYFMDYFSTNVVVKSIPDALNDYQTNIMLFFYQDYADRYGIELSELLASEGLDSTDDLIELYREYNTKNATYYLVIQAIAEDAGISVTDKDVTDYYIEIYGGADYSAQEEQFGLPYIKHSVLCLKVIDYIVENAVLL